MTHIENISHILENGITHQRSINSNTNYAPIGYASLISKRESIVLFNGNTLGRYIPFYFGARMPMLYVILLGSNSKQYNMQSISAVDIVYCITSLEKIRSHNLNFVFSNGHAVSALSDFFDETNIESISDLIDWSAVTATYWNDDNDLDLKRRKEAEFLVQEDIPAAAILGFAVYNLKAKQRLLKYGVDENKIVVRPEYYF